MNTQQFDEDTWAEVRDELNQRFPELGLSAMESGVDPEEAAAPRAMKGRPTVRKFIWGFRIEVSSKDLGDFLKVAKPANAIVAAIGPTTGPAAPFIVAAAGFMAGALELLEKKDHGHGVYISMTWVTPGVFVPTSVPAKKRDLVPTVE